MAVVPGSEDFLHYHDELFNHMIGVNIYTPLCLFFALPQECDKARIIQTLRAGIEKLSRSFPWLTAQVIKTTLDHGQPGPRQVVPLEKTCRLIVKDYTHDSNIPSMEEFQKARFPCALIDGETFTSLVGVPNSREGDDCPVLFAQANFIKGGLVLSLAGEHSTMDGGGTGQAIRLFDKACHGESFTNQEVLEGNRGCSDTVPLLDPSTYQPGPELDFLVQKPSNSIETENISTPAKCTWAYVHFSLANLSALKRLASESAASLNDSTTATRVTSNDALTAFIWQSTARARAPRLPQHAVSTIGRAVDVRAALSVSPSYLGNMSNHAYTTLAVASLTTASLNTIALTLRTALDPEKLAHGIRSLATFFSQTNTRSDIHYGANMDFSHDIFFSSWARLPCYQHDFNLGLGSPLSARRPGFMAIEGLFYLLPMDRDGGIDAMICLRDVDLAHLKADEEFAKFSTWIG